MKNIAVLFVVCSCTSLGPMPATTGISAVPVGQPSIEAQVGSVPSFYLSQSAVDRAQGTAIPQASALVELDRFIRLPGLIFGGRIFGPSGDTLVEPYVGYRAKLRDGLAIGGGAFGTTKGSQMRLASYRGSRLGGEAAVDVTAWEPASWFAVHAQAAVSATRIAASGTYCIDPATGIARDCDEEHPAMNTMVSASTEGVFPAAAATLALDFGRDAGRQFRGMRLAALGAIGRMPLVRDGVKTGDGTYTTVGLTLTLSLALADGEPDTVPE